MLPRSALVLLLLLLLQRRVPILLAGADSVNSHADFPYCRTPGKETCAVCADTYQLWQPCQVRAWVSESVVLPCAFRQSWGRTRDVRVSWHAGYFRSNIIVFNRTEVGSVPVHANFSGRARLVGDPLSGNTSLLLNDLRPSDSNRYFCGVSVLLEGRRWETWQGILGTRLNIAEVGAEPQPPCGGFLLSAVRAAWVLLALLLLGLGVFLARRRGSRQGAPPSGK